MCIKAENIFQIRNMLIPLIIKRLEMTKHFKTYVLLSWYKKVIKNVWFKCKNVLINSKKYGFSIHHTTLPLSLSLSDNEGGKSCVPVSLHLEVLVC